MSSEHKRYSVNIAETAAGMIDTHAAFLANVSIDAALKLVDDFENAFISLETMPKRCSIYNTNKTEDVYRQLIVGRYLIIFSIDEQDSTVNIETIFDSRQNNDI